MGLGYLDQVGCHFKIVPLLKRESAGKYHIRTVFKTISTLHQQLTRAKDVGRSLAVCTCTKSHTTVDVHILEDQELPGDLSLTQPGGEK